MGEPKIEFMSLDAFLDWEAKQAARHEFVDGVARMMAGGTIRHAVMMTLVASALLQRLRTGGCRPTTSDLLVVLPNGDGRYPDVTVICPPFQPGDRTTREPVLVVEILSPSTAAYDQSRKLAAYRTIPALRHILILHQDEPRAEVWTRGAAVGADGWTVSTHVGASADVPLPGLGIVLALGELYDEPGAA